MIMALANMVMGLQQGCGEEEAQQMLSAAMKTSRKMMDDIKVEGSGVSFMEEEELAGMN